MYKKGIKSFCISNNAFNYFLDYLKKNKIQLLKEKIWTIPILLESPKGKDFQTPDVEIDFLIDSGAELAKLLLKYPMVYATSKFDVGRVSSPLHLPLKPDAFFKKQHACKVPIHLQDKVNRLLDILK